MIILERFEDDTAVLEADGEIIKISREYISGNASEGDVLTENSGFYSIDVDGTEKRKQEILKFQNSLWG